MNENHFTFSLIHKETKKYGDISDGVSDGVSSDMSFSDWLISTVG